VQSLSLPQVWDPPAPVVAAPAVEDEVAAPVPV
jgi:hypothetical protein